ncbi:SufE family protein [Brumimicrobium glaciale]|jgi:cysteine desulfuration protein SufE|uniref:SufE family protein n=1 Tax=Brumimicrobium glaciale TaxID=200475 RepID=A0A4Q4KQU2_9FLAO|nr:SufE family protein [Brumimicrobium glaciale]RYM35906.1 SufE family protein [Brumimicrobium glaciale]
MSIKEKEQEIIDEFALYDDWMDKYEYIIELGKDLPLIEAQYKTKDRLIKGCQSQVWLHADCKDNKMKFSADSDAIITKGIIALLIRVVNDESPADVATSEFKFIKEIGLQEHLSPTRSNGLVSMVKDMKLNALKAVK